MSTRRPSLTGWLAPLFVGTFFGAWGAAAVHALTDGRLPWVPYIGVVKWSLYLMAFSALAAVELLAVALVDVMLLKAKLRMLPSGARAWGLAIAAPLAGGIALKAWPAVEKSALMTWSASTLIPTLVAATLLRIAFGKRP